MAQEKPKPLYDRLGGVYSIATVVDEFIERLLEAELIDVFASASVARTPNSSIPSDTRSSSWTTIAS